MRKTVGAVLAAAAFMVGAQGIVGAAPADLMGVDSPALVLLEDEEYYIDDPDAEVGDVYVDVDTGEEYVVVEE